ncbi:MAG TPA: RcnB family protein [Rhizomicrobium sp.]|jgi:Ni/Co efflux regulator RcnB|nr:RcnB family protein [Rhizomicrobium sp.]
MNRSFITAIGLGLALMAAPAVAQDRNDTNKRVVVHKGNETVRKNVDERPNGSVQRRTVTERPNGTMERRTVTERPNGAMERRTMTERPNGNRVVRKAVRAPRRFRAARPWHAPRGFAYRRFRLGERVPSVFLASLYFLTDFTAYGLAPPPPGYIWIREGSDAVLVDRYTGEVIQVEYDIFY